MQHGELRTIRCPWSIDKLIKLIFTYILDIFIAGSRNSYTASRINKKWEYEWWSTEETRRVDQQKPKTQIKMTTTRKYVETCRMICQSG